MNRKGNHRWAFQIASFIATAHYDDLCNVVALSDVFVSKAVITCTTIGINYSF